MSDLKNPYENSFGSFGALTPTGQDIARIAWNEGAAAERARICEWLRGCWEGDALAKAVNRWADAIESGAHVKDGAI